MSDYLENALFMEIESMKGEEVSELLNEVSEYLVDMMRAKNGGTE